jgi:hypothetical protein
VIVGNHYDNVGQWLPEGWHKVTVISHKMAEGTKKGTPGVTFFARNANGKQAKSQTFWLTDSAVTFLASFAMACGLTKDEAQRYDTDNPNSHTILHGREVYILVVRDGKYHEFDEWQSIEDGPPADEPKVNRSVSAATEDVPPRDEVPF